MNSVFNICVVDDDDIYQFTTTKTLESLDIEKSIDVFSDGEEALDFILNNINEVDKLPDVILLDINMPIMDGFQFMDEYDKIKSKLAKNITIFMVSSSVDPVDMDRAKNINAISDYLLKPIKSDDLKELVLNLEANRNY